MKLFCPDLGIIGRMIKVCILTSVHSPFDIRIFHKEAKSLRRAGYEITLVAPHDKDEIVDGINVLSVPKPSNRIERMTKSIAIIYLKAVKIDADIYHFHDPELIPVGLILKGLRKIVIYDVHEDAPKQNLSKPYLPVTLRKPISSIIAFIENFSARRFSGVAAATPFINRRFLDIGANSVNVSNFPILSEFNPSMNQWEEKEKAVCYVGVIARIRGAFEMVEAIEKTDCRLILAGNLEPGIKQKLMRMPGWSQAEPLGYVNRAGVRAVYARSMAGLVLLSPIINYKDALPVKMFEYMSAGIPVIASNFPLWKEIVEGAECGVCVDPQNTNEIAQAIKSIFKNSGEAKRMGENGRRAVEETFNWELEEIKLLRLYSDLLLHI